MRFMLAIDLGNEAMRDDADIADALQGVIDRLDRNHGPVSLIEGGVLDHNGNGVGGYEVINDQPSAMRALRDLARHARDEGYTSPGDVVEDVADWEVDC